MNLLPNNLYPQTRLQLAAALAGAVGLGSCLIAAFIDPQNLGRSYWFAWLFFSGISFGAIPLLGIHFLTSSIWGRAAGIPAQAAARILPVMLVLIIPVLLLLPEVFPWAQPGISAHAHSIHKAAYLNTPWFIGRTLLYFGLSIGFIFMLRRCTSEGPPSPRLDPATLSGPGLVAYVLCMNFAATDWIMSLQPQWYSTMLAVIFMVSQLLNALALSTVVVASTPSLLAAHPSAVRIKILHDLGNLLLAFVVFWAYITFSQFLIIWSGNLPQEISWYVSRRSGGWQYIAVFLALFQFALPFALLLSRRTKRDPKRLGRIALWVLAGNALNFYWLVIPALRPGPLSVHWLDLAALAGIGGLWTFLFIGFLPSPTPKLSGEPIP